MRLNKISFLGIFIFFISSLFMNARENMIYSNTNEFSGTYTNSLKIRMDKFEKKVIEKHGNVLDNDLKFREAATEIYNEWDKELNIIYNELIKELKNLPNAKKYLIQAQREWIKYRDSEGTFTYYLAEDEGGTIGINPQISKKIRIVKERTLALAYTYDIYMDNK